MEAACLSCLAGTMPVRTCSCNLPGREMPPRALAERSRVQRITLGAVFSGRAVLLLVCAIASTLGVLLCPFSRATARWLQGQVGGWPLQLHAAGSSAWATWQRLGRSAVATSSLRNSCSSGKPQPETGLGPPRPRCNPAWRLSPLEGQRCNLI